MTGADAIVTALTQTGVDTCFMNPGTSEMHLVAALSRTSGMRTVLCLFEGVASGAADGYARATGKPAAVLLHLGPGYANAAANLHNARRAHSPMVVLVGDHTSSHRLVDPPLASDISKLASTTSKWVADLGEGGVEIVEEAVRQSMTAPAGVATVIVPADHAWAEVSTRSSRCNSRLNDNDSSDVLSRIATFEHHANASQRPAVLLGGTSLKGPELQVARMLSDCGFTIYAETFPACQDRGNKTFEPTRLPYAAAAARQLLGRHDVLFIVNAAVPVAFFAYPGDDGVLLPEDLVLIPAQSCAEILEAVRPASAAARSGLDPKIPVSSGAQDNLLDRTARALADYLPENAIVSDDAVTASGALWEATRDAKPHRWMTLTGGAIGQGMPVAIGAAVAQPSAKVVALTGDGAGMYTLQSLWTMAREDLNILVIVFANRSYRILEYEFQKTGAGSESDGSGMFRLDEPAIDWCMMARSMGVEARRVDNDLAIDEAIAAAMATKGPVLLEVVTS